MLNPDQRAVPAGISRGDSTIKKQFDAIKEELCEFTTEEWPK